LPARKNGPERTLLRLLEPMLARAGRAERQRLVPRLNPCQSRPQRRIAVKASGVAKPARIYDLRSTFASNALAAGVTVFELARVMRTSVRMIERHR
jgi:hypothetical protein